MKVSEICKIANDCDRLRDILYQDDHKLTVAEIQEICDLLWDYRVELLNKEVKQELNQVSAKIRLSYSLSQRRKQYMHQLAFNHLSLC